MNPKAQKSVIVILGFLVLANGVAWAAVFELSDPPLLEITFFKLSQGDAIFIETPQRHQILIDGGKGAEILKKLGQKMPFFDRSLDLVILTHPEYDHLGGLIFVLKHYNVKKVLWTGVKNDTKSFERWKELLSKEGSEVFLAHSGLRIKAPPNVKMNVIYPVKLLGTSSEGFNLDLNDTSIVADLNFNSHSFLFTGDISSSVEKIIVNRGTDLKAQVLKVGHHGSRYSSSEEFLKEVSPKLAVISVGEDNPYHHPDLQVLQRLKRFGINTKRTDQEGDITILSDGRSLYEE